MTFQNVPKLSFWCEKKSENWKIYFHKIIFLRLFSENHSLIGSFSYREFLLHKKFGRAIFFSYREFSLTRSSLIGSFDCISQTHSNGVLVLFLGVWGWRQTPGTPFPGLGNANPPGNGTEWEVKTIELSSPTSWGEQWAFLNFLILTAVKKTVPKLRKIP